MEDSESQFDSEEGNTSLSSSRSRGWCFTWNNPGTPSQMIEILEVAGAKSYLFQLECGKNTNVPHFQGFMYFENQRTFSSIKEMCREMHISKMKDLRASIKYCCKEDTRVAGPWSKNVKIPRSLKLIDPDDRIWQKDLVKELEVVPDDRKIIWYHDPVGGSGKTALAKYLVVKKNALVVSGKGNDIKYAISKHIEKHGEVNIIIFLFPRTVEGFVSYDAIESLKDGIFFSGKYESGMCVFASPHIVCFANFAPDLSALSLDRWEVRKLSEEIDGTRKFLEN